MSPECTFGTGFWGKYFAKVAFPFVFAGMLLCFTFIRLVLAKRKDRKAVSFSMKKSSLIRVFSIFAFAVSSMYLFIVSSILQPFACFKASDGVYVMTNNPSEYCYSGTWLKRLPWITFFLVFYGIGFPLLTLRILVKNKAVMKQDQFNNVFGSLVSPYRSSMYFWEIVAMLKKTVFAIILTIIPASGYENVKHLVTILVMLIWLWFECIQSPYLVSEYNFASQW